MRPTGRPAWRRPAACAPPMAAAVEPLQASSVCVGWPGRAGAWPRAASGTRRRAAGCSTPRRGYARPRCCLGRRSDLTHCRPSRRLSRGSVRPRADSGRRAGPQAGGGGWVSRAQRADGIVRHRPGDSQASTRMLSMLSARTGTGLYGACLYIEAARRAAITTATPRRRAGSWCVTGGSVSVGWTRRSSVGARNREVRGLVGRSRVGRPDPERRAEAGRKNLTVRWQVWSAALSHDRGTPERCERGDRVRRHADAESGGATEHEDEISITVPRVSNSQVGRFGEAP